MKAIKSSITSTKWPPSALPGAPKPKPPKPKPSTLLAMAAALALVPAISHAQHAPCVDSRTGLRLQCALPYGEFDPQPPPDYLIAPPHRWPAPHGRHDRHEREPDERHQWRT